MVSPSGKYLIGELVFGSIRVELSADKSLEWGKGCPFLTAGNNSLIFQTCSENRSGILEGGYADIIG